MSCRIPAYEKTRLTYFFSAGIAIAAYFIGGCAYQRVVLHQRGWRQCPNYGLWAGAASFIRVSLASLVSSMLSIPRTRQRKNTPTFKPSKGRGGLSLPISRPD